MTTDGIDPAPEDRRVDEALCWQLAYLRGQNEITLTASGPECTIQALLALVNLGAHVRALTSEEATPWQMAVRRLTLVTDELLATLLVPLDDATDAQAVETWKRALSEVRALQ